MSRPLVVVTTGRKTPSEPYERVVERAGARPLVRVPDGTPLELPEGTAGLILAGGASVEPARYGSGIEPGVTPTMDPPRDELEWSMLDQALERGLPVLGICRGLQVVNVYYGGSLYQELAHTSYRGSHRPAEDRDHLAHSVRACSGRLFELFGPGEAWVNSIHRQAVKRLGDDLIVTAIANDGVIEGIETVDRQVIAVQWHPEELPDDVLSKALFADLLERIRNPEWVGATL
ncbi:putative glutamine amidotransferase [Spinactinospora alkalitolerans]|uniref:Putative glutamine amidotransferase n=1 Tax=Spinactinospora alkalitolerans TaxID=687207 RepID=A0A852TU30_9ACTN|nr:gamma-glutamyl-gamma-aminobutyrate hydrolase family protein [Spinactinospora alkalitolerans]NYE47946.1 putative glutamine amidotransferase [Spinactinospora alkalitolerans]